MYENENNPDARIRISPRAMNLAAANGIDISRALPTGPAGRIIERDIERLITEKTGTLPVSEISSDITEKVSDTVPEAAGSPEEVAGAEGSPSDSGAENPEIPSGSEPDRIYLCPPRLTAHADLTGLLDFHKRLSEKREKAGLPDITVGEMIAYLFAKLVDKYDSGAGISYVAPENCSTRSGIVGMRSGLSEFSRAVKERLPGKAGYVIYDLSGSHITEVCPPLEEGVSMSLGIGGVDSASRRIGLTLTGGDIMKAAEILEDLCDGIADFTLSLV